LLSGEHPNKSWSEKKNTKEPQERKTDERTEQSKKEEHEIFKGSEK
jgi:hypothetical protein